MANTSVAWGFIPENPDDAHVGSYVCAASGGPIRVGDPVKLVNTGTVALAAAGDRMVGVAKSMNGLVSGVPTFGSVPTSNAAAFEVEVWDDPDTVFIGQITTALALTNVGNLVDHTNSSTGANSYGRSGSQLDSSTVNTIAAGWVIRGLVDAADNAWGANAKVRCKIYEHYWTTEDTAESSAEPGI